MNRSPILEVEDCFGMEAGTPTLTVILEDVERMIPYHSLVGGRFVGNLIELTFQEWSVSIGGHHLGPLWSAFQLQDVRWVRAVAGVDADGLDGECAVTSLGIESEES